MQQAAAQVSSAHPRSLRPQPIQQRRIAASPVARASLRGTQVAYADIAPC